MPDIVSASMVAHAFASSAAAGMLSRLVPLRRRLHEAWRAAGCQSSPADTTSASTSAAAAPDNAASDAAYGAVWPLKLVVMSATLATSDFVDNRRLFASPPPLLRVPARTYPVTIHYAKRTEMQDYLATAVRKVWQQQRPG